MSWEYSKIMHGICEIKYIIYNNTHTQLQIPIHKINSMFSYIPVRLRQKLPIKLKIFRASDLPNPADTKNVMNLIFQQDFKHSYTPESRIQFTNWLKQCTPTILANYNKLATPSNFGLLFHVCHRFKFYQKEFFELANQFMKTQYKSLMSLTSATKIYTTAVQLHHAHNKYLYEELQKQIIWKLKKFGKINKQNVKIVNSFIIALGLNQFRTVDEKNSILKQIDQVLENSGPNMMRFTFFNAGSLIFQIISTNRLILNPATLKIYENFHAQFQKNKIQQPDIKKDQHFLSIFEKIFENDLRNLGYQFQTNSQIKGRQYDFIITGHNKEKNFPFANISLSDPVHQMPSIDENKVRSYSKQLNFEWQPKISNQQKVVIDLNGPYHYIISDSHPPETITRRQQFGYEKLPLYGIYKYNSINYEKWESVSRYSRDRVKFIQQKINNPICLPKRF